MADDSDTESRIIRVLYLHGFEEHDESPKPTLLRSHEKIEIYMPPLDVYFDKKNGLIASLFRSKKFLSVLVSAVVTRFLPSPLSNISLIALLGCVYFYRQSFVQEAFRISLERTLRVATTALRRYNPDVVVGFSWGGSLACNLIESNKWKGPTVLLAPAYYKLNQYAGYSTGRKIQYAESMEEVVVVQGLKDQLIDPNQQEEFSKTNGFKYIPVENEIHNLWGFSDLPNVVLNVSRGVQSKY